MAVKRPPKLTVDQLIQGIPVGGSITQKQLAKRLGCSTEYTKRIADDAIAQGLIECFTVFGCEKHFKRVK